MTIEQPQTNIDIHELENIKNIIDKMDKNQHIEILKIINKDPAVKINENKSGIYINLSFLPENTMKEIKTYISYIQDQEKVLTQMENIKAEYTNTFFMESELQSQLKRESGSGSVLEEENDIIMNVITTTNDFPVFTK
jgi:hypothetical protein